METLGIVAIFVLVFGAVLYFRIRRVWRMYRVIAITVSGGSDEEAFRYKLTESIRTLGFREVSQTGPVRSFRGPAWMRWCVGLQDISVEPAGSGAAVVTGPSFKVSVIGRLYPGAALRPYRGAQPVWPLCRGVLRLMAVGVGLLAASIVPFLLFGAR